MAVTTNPQNLTQGIAGSLLITQPTDSTNPSSSISVTAPSPAPQGADYWVLTLTVNAGSLAAANTVYTAIGQVGNNSWTLTDTANPGGQSTNQSGLVLTAEQCSAATLTCTYGGNPAGFFPVSVDGNSNAQVSMVQGTVVQPLAQIYTNANGNNHLPSFNPGALPTNMLFLYGLSDGLKSDLIKLQPPKTADWQFKVLGFNGPSQTQWTGIVYDPANPTQSGWLGNDNPEWLRLSFGHYSQVVIMVQNTSQQYSNYAINLTDIGPDPKNPSYLLAQFAVITGAGPTQGVSVKITIECGSGGE